MTPDHLRCPITFARMRSPVVIEDGHTFERRALARWLTTHRTNPLTGLQLTDDTYRPARGLRDAIREFEEKHGREIAPRPTRRRRRAARSRNPIPPSPSRARPTLLRGPLSKPSRSRGTMPSRVNAPRTLVPREKLALRFDYGVAQLLADA